MPVAQKVADEVVFRRFQGEGVEFFLNFQDDARPVSGRCNFDRVFGPFSLFRNARPQIVIILKFDFPTNGEIDQRLCYIEHFIFQLCDI